MDYGELALKFAFIVLAISANAIFVAAEFSLVRLRPSRVEELAREGKYFFLKISKALVNVNDYISAAQIGITISSLVLGAIAEPVFHEVLAPLFTYFVLPDALSHSISFAISIVIVTCFHMMFGELLPKNIAMQYPEQVAVLTIIPLDLLFTFTKPIVWALTRIGNSIMKMIGLPVLSKSNVLIYSEEELKFLLSQSAQEGIIETAEKDMVQNVFEFGDTVVREVMTPRTDLIGIDIGATIDQATELAIRKKVSKLPVYEGNLDNIVGIVLSVDLLKGLQESKGQDSLSSVVRSVIKVPENKTLIDLLADFKKKTQQIAIVLDEFGGTYGLVTLEDIIEVIVGDIRNEGESTSPDIEKLSAHEFVIEATVTINDVNEALEARFPKEDFDTIGGFVFGLLGREALVGDEVVYGHWLFVVLECTRRIEKVKLIRLLETTVSGEEYQEINGNAPQLSVSESIERSSK